MYCNTWMPLKFFEYILSLTPCTTIQTGSAQYSRSNFHKFDYSNDSTHVNQTSRWNCIMWGQGLHTFQLYKCTLKQGLFSGLFYVTTRTEDSTGDLGSAIQRIWKWVPIFSDSLSPQLSKNNIALLEPKSPWLCCLHQTPPRYPKCIRTYYIPWILVDRFELAIIPTRIIYLCEYTCNFQKPYWSKDPG